MYTSAEYVKYRFLKNWSINPQSIKPSPLSFCHQNKNMLSKMYYYLSYIIVKLNVLLCYLIFNYNVLNENYI